MGRISISGFGEGRVNVCLSSCCNLAASDAGLYLRSGEGELARDGETKGEFPPVGLTEGDFPPGPPGPRLGLYDGDTDSP